MTGNLNLRSDAMRSNQTFLFTSLAFLFSIICNDGCLIQGCPNQEQVSQNFQGKGSNATPPDSLQFDYENFEHNLDIFRNVDSLDVSVSGMVHFFIFRIDRQKFAVLIDSATKVYKFTGTRFKKIHHIQTGDGITDISKRKLDVNLDGFMDLVIELPSGGTYGSDFVFLFYHPIRKTLVYDAKSNMRNCIIDVKKARVKSQYHYSYAVYAIEKYSFRMLESYEYLFYTSDNPRLKNKLKKRVFNRKGRIVKTEIIPDK